MATLASPPSDDTTNEFLNDADVYGKSIASQYRKKLYKNIILEKLSNPQYKASFLHQNQDDQIKSLQQEIQQEVKKTKNADINPDGNELRAVLAEDEIKELLTD